MASDRSTIQPVFGLPRRKPSSDVLDTAETLVENLDSLADILDRLAEKYEIESKYNVSEAVTCDDGELVPSRGTEHNLFSKLKTGLDSAKVLIGCMRREKGRLMKRQMSVECRMGEIEDYRKHMKEDMTSLHEMVDLLSLRVIQLESKLCDEQEAYESLDAEKRDLDERLQKIQLQLQDKESSTTEKQTSTEKETSSSKSKSNSTLALENKELHYKVEILVVENRKLKEIIRNQHQQEDSEQESDLGTPRSSVSEWSEDGTNNNNNNRKFIIVSDESDF